MWLTLKVYRYIARSSSILARRLRAFFFCICVTSIHDSMEFRFTLMHIHVHWHSPELDIFGTNILGKYRAQSQCILILSPCMYQLSFLSTHLFSFSWSLKFCSSELWLASLIHFFFSWIITVLTAKSCHLWLHKVNYDNQSVAACILKILLQFVSSAARSPLESDPPLG